MRSSSATIRRTRLKSGCILARSPFRPRGFASAQSSSARATGHRSSPRGWRPISTTSLVAAPSSGSVTVGTRRSSRSSGFPSLQCPSDRQRWPNRLRSFAASGERSRSPITATITAPSENASSHRPYSSHLHRSSWPEAVNAPRSGSSLVTPTRAISDRDMPQVW